MGYHEERSEILWYCIRSPMKCISPCWRLNGILESIPSTPCCFFDSFYDSSFKKTHNKRTKHKPNTITVSSAIATMSNHRDEDSVSNASSDYLDVANDENRDSSSGSRDVATEMSNKGEEISGITGTATSSSPPAAETSSSSNSSTSIEDSVDEVCSQQQWKKTHWNKRINEWCITQRYDIDNDDGGDACTTDSGSHNDDNNMMTISNKTQYNTGNQTRHTARQGTRGRGRESEEIGDTVCRHAPIDHGVWSGEAGVGLAQCVCRQRGLRGQPRGTAEPLCRMWDNQPSNHSLRQVYWPSQGVSATVFLFNSSCGHHRSHCHPSLTWISPPPPPLRWRLQICICWVFGKGIGRKRNCAQW